MSATAVSDGPGARTAPRSHALVALLIVAWLAALAWTRPLTLPDEGRYAGVALEMLRGGDWLTPRLDGLPFFHKPPLFYWITAASMQLFGVHEGTARAASLLGATLAAFAAYAFARRWLGDDGARRTLGALLVQPLFYLGAQFANLDMLVAGCITATILLLADAALCAAQARPHRTALLLAYAAAAFGVLAKGLIGVLLPALVVGAWLLLSRRLRLLPRLLWWPGPLLFALIAVPWFAAMQGRFPDFLHYFFIVQHLQRFAAGGFNNAQPFWFFPVVLALLSLPWLPWLWRHAVPRAMRRPDPGSLRLLMRLWVGIVVLFFSLPQSKLVGYVLPVVVPLVFLMADGFEASALAAGRARTLWRTSLLASAAVGLGVVLALTVHPLASSRELGAALAARHAGRDPVYLLDRYDYDLPFYGDLSAPMRVVSDWSDPAVFQRDNWRKELADAGRFDASRAQTTLVLPDAVSAAWCAAPVSWVVGPTGAVAAHPVLASAERVLMHRGTSVWRLDRRQADVAAALKCEGTPNGGSADR